mmetsp:Transcript_27047/g.46928  ORF Transcript_27047/g.46928 Transcript_27047/m.46928 type:complete len:383 (-) Transcript_27047:47-1195(-)
MRKCVGVTRTAHSATHLWLALTLLKLPGASISTPTASCPASTGADAASENVIGLLQTAGNRRKASLDLEELANSEGATSDLQNETDLERASSDEQAFFMSHLQEQLNRSAACDLCGHSQHWLFILGTGRSGSTSLLQMVNEIPGFHLAGENKGVLTSLTHLFAHAQSLAEKGTILSWTHGDIVEHRVLCALQSYIRAIGGFSKSDRVIGFKEIRHSTEEALSFFQKLFPCGRFIGNTRKHLDAQIASREHVGWKLKLSEVSELEKSTQSLESWVQKHHDISILMRLGDNFTTQGFNKLLNWLGVRGCSFISVAHENRKGYSKGTTNGHLQGVCNFAWDGWGNSRSMHHLNGTHTKSTTKLTSRSAYHTAQHNTRDEFHNRSS